MRIPVIVGAMKRMPVAALALAGLVSLGGCSAKKQLTAEQYYSEARSFFRDGAFRMAIENFRELLDQYPFSDYTEEAELRIAHAHYLDGAHIEAIASLTDFERRHPTSAHLPFVGYLLGMSYTHQMGSIDRDQSAAKSAESYFAAVAAQYPGSPYAELARGELAACRGSLAAHELYVADFYRRRGNGRAAELRALDVVGRYPEAEGADEALYRLGRLYQRQDDPFRAGLAFGAIVKQYPASSRAKAAQRALRRLGVEGDATDGDLRGMLLAASGYSSGGGQGAAETVIVPGIDDEDGRPAVRAPAASPPIGIGGPGTYGRRGPAH